MMMSAIKEVTPDIKSKEKAGLKVPKIVKVSMMNVLLK